MEPMFAFSGSLLGQCPMDKSPLNDPKNYRNWAAEIRAIAGTMKHVDAQATMFRLAEDYEKLADRTAPNRYSDRVAELK
jgi:hypothetical protein